MGAAHYEQGFCVHTNKLLGINRIYKKLHLASKETLFHYREGLSYFLAYPKNHSFSDGNKRIAATLFLWFLNGNRILYRADGSKRIPDNTLVAITLMIAESRTEEKDDMVKVVVNLINQQN